MRNRKQYDNVSQMVADLSESQDFTQGFEKRLRERSVVKSLLAMRALADMSQEDIANKLGCTQSKISKLENGNDADLTLADLFGYIEAIGMDAQIVVMRDSRPTSPLVHRVKHHFFAMKEAMEELAELPGSDNCMASAIAKFFGEAAYNLFKMIIDASQKLPEEAHGSLPVITIIEDSPSPRPNIVRHCGMLVRQ